MPDLKRRVLDQNDGRYWALFGRNGVVSWVLYSDGSSLDCYGPVHLHSPLPQRDEQYPCAACPFLEGDCYVEGSDPGGELIGEAWEEAGFDDEAIWHWLQEYYKELVST